MAQVDRSEGLVGNTAFKAPVRAATTVAVTLSGEQTIDGIVCVEGNRVLVKDQSVLNAAQNGIYVVSTGSWNRADDFDGSLDVTGGTMVTISEGTQANTYWILSTTGTITIGTTSLAFVQANHIETDIHGATNKVTPVNADEFGLWDSVSGLLNKVSLSNLKTVLAAACSAGWNALTATTATTSTNQSGGTVAATTVTASSTIIGSASVKGATATGTTTSSAIVGVASTSGSGVYGTSSSGVGVYGDSASSYGVVAQSNSGYGLYASSNSSYGAYGISNSNHGVVAAGDTTTPAKSAFRIVPQDAEPTGANEVGDIYVTTAGLLKICTVAGSPGTWVSVGTQV